MYFCTGIISIIAYGITIKRYGLQNLHRQIMTSHQNIRIKIFENRLVVPLPLKRK